MHVKHDGQVPAVRSIVHRYSKAIQSDDDTALAATFAEVLYRATYSDGERKLNTMLAVTSTG